MSADQPDDEGSAPPPDARDVSDRDIPERPSLAEEVELAGRMEDSAFERQPWLISRHGGFVQVSELLYRLAEQCDGERLLSEVADSLSSVISRSVSTDDVRQLLREKLIPLGIVAKADGSVVATRDTAGGRSPLQIDARMRTIGPELLDPAARLFQVLFWPPVLLVILGLGLALIGWLLFVHGLGQGFHDALYQPWLILVLLPIIVASAIFHEFGHAAALRYGGGKVRGMGAGIYLVYPVFYTDVTDNYRLGRWAKVRTDTGGFYFNLVFALAIMAIYLLTGQAFLLLAILAILFSIVHQSLPFVRLDGYWTLADLTGVPDPLGHIGPFIRSVLPFQNWKGRRLPPLKTWVKVAYAVYLLVTIPLLAALTIYMVASAPRILATSWDSFLRQLEALRAAWSVGDALNVAATLLGIAVLAVTSAGIVFFLYRLATGGLRRLWSWGSESPRRRVVAGAGTLAAAGLVAWLWMPPLDATGGQGGPLAANLRPIAEEDRLNLNDAVFAEGGLLGPAAAVEDAPAAPAQPAPAAAPEPTPTATPAPTATPLAAPVPPVDTGEVVPVPPVDAGEAVPELPAEEQLPADLPLDLDNPIIDFELGH